MKILHLSSEKTWRGGEQQIYYLHEQLLLAGHSSVVFCRRGSAMSQRLIKNNLPLKEASFSSAYDVGSAWQLKTYCQQHDIDVVHAHTSKGHTLVMISHALGNKSRIVLSRRVDVPIKDNWWSKYKYNHQSIKKIICVSDKIKEITATGLISPNKLTTIHSGVNTARLSRDKKHKPLQQEFPELLDKAIIGNVSALSDHKDFGTFIAVAKKLISIRQNLHFLIVGDGELKEAIVAEIKAQHMADHITMTGFRNDLENVFDTLDIFLFTSKTEGLGTTVLDALTFKVPVVATAAGGVPEIIKRHNGGLLCPVKDVQCLTDSTLRILDDPTLARQLQLAGEETAKFFSKENTAIATLKVYAEVMS
jgi:glycosyltransferase involved in cell wall biosynthesis